MLSDEELKEIEQYRDRRKEEEAKATGHPLGALTNAQRWLCADREATPLLTALLAEVKRLRKQIDDACCALCESCLRDDEPTLAWQSVADGAKPGPEDWYVAAHVQRVRNMDMLEVEDLRAGEFLEGDGDIVVTTYARPRFPGQELPRDTTTHFLVIPPPPIKRETKGPAVWPDGGTFEVSIPATQVSAYSGGPVARVADMTFKLIRTGVECVFVEMNSTQMHDYYAIGGHAWKIGDPIKRES